MLQPIVKPNLSPGENVTAVPIVDGFDAPLDKQQAILQCKKCGSVFYRNIPKHRTTRSAQELDAVLEASYTPDEDEWTNCPHHCPRTVGSIRVYCSPKKQQKEWGTPPWENQS